MHEVACAHCGAMMKPEGHCPVCELPAAPSAPAQVPVDPSPLARWWRSGQLAVLLAAGSFLGSLFLPLMTRVPMVIDREVHPAVSVSPLDLAMGTYSAFKGQMTAWMLPGAGLFLLSLLRSRRRGAAMRASRLLVGVVSLMPLMSAVMPFLKLKKRGVEAGVGPALALIVAGVAMGLLGALWFGRDVEDERHHAPHDEA